MHHYELAMKHFAILRYTMLLKGRSRTRQEELGTQSRAIAPFREGFLPLVATYLPEHLALSPGLTIFVSVVTQYVT